MAKARVVEEEKGLTQRLTQVEKSRQMEDTNHINAITKGFGSISMGANWPAKGVNFEVHIEDGKSWRLHDLKGIVKGQQYLILTGSKSWTGYEKGDDEVVPARMGLSSKPGERRSFATPDIQSVVAGLEARGHKPAIQRGVTTTIALPIIEKPGKNTVIEDIKEVLAQAKLLGEIVADFNNGKADGLDKVAKLRGNAGERAM